MRSLIEFAVWSTVTIPVLMVDMVVIAVGLIGGVEMRFLCLGLSSSRNTMPPPMQFLISVVPSYESLIELLIPIMVKR